MIIAGRQGLMGGRKPYDAEIEYLESTGTQWIDTGITQNAETYFEADASFVNLTRGRFGAYGNNSRFYFGVMSNMWGCGVNSPIYNHSIGNADALRHTFSIYGREFKIDGTTVFSGDDSLVPTYNTIFLFARHEAGPAEIASAKLFGAKIKEGDTLVRDLIPVRVGNVGYMYDKVNGKLFGNSGTGTFIVGPDL